MKCNRFRSAVTAAKDLASARSTDRVPAAVTDCVPAAVTDRVPAAATDHVPTAAKGRGSALARHLGQGVAMALALLVAVSCWQRLDPPGPEPVDWNDPDAVDWSQTLDYVFDENQMPQIRIHVSQAEWDRLLAAYDQDKDTQEYVHCDLTYQKGIDLVTVEDAALRLKGNTSRRRPQEGDRLRHVHFGVNLHKYHDDAAHTLRGLRRFDLKWFKDDPAYVREIYCYDLFRRYGVWTGLRDVYARLWLQVGDGPQHYYGIYGLMEHVDKNWLRSHRDSLGSAGGYLWKCGGGATLSSVGASIGADDGVHSYTYELKTHTDDGLPQAKAQLQDFIRNLTTLQNLAFYQWIASVTDIELLLRTYAVNVAVGMWDDYWNNGNNYYLYFNSTAPTGYQFYFIPYDYDNTLGTSLQCGVQTDAGRHDPYQWGPKENPLLYKILQNPVWRSRYRELLQELCAPSGEFSYQRSVARIRAWHERIAPYVANDTGEDMSIADRPASWGNHGEYRLLAPGASNFFQVKSAAVAAME